MLRQPSSSVTRNAPALCRRSDESSESFIDDSSLPSWRMRARSAHPQGDGAATQTAAGCACIDEDGPTADVACVSSDREETSTGRLKIFEAGTPRRLTNDPSLRVRVEQVAANFNNCDCTSFQWASWSCGHDSCHFDLADLL